MQKIDAHVHIDYNHFDEKTLLSYIHRNHIEKIWLLTWEESTPSIPRIYDSLSITRVCEFYQKYPDLVVPFYAPDPSREGLEDLFKKYVKRGIKGCGELKVSFLWKDDIIDKYLRIVQKFHLPLLFHMEMPRLQYIPSNFNTFTKFLEKILNGALNGVVRHYLLQLADFVPPMKKHIKNHQVYFPGYLYDFAGLEQRLNQYPEISFIGHGPHFWNNISVEIDEKFVHQRGKISSFGIIDRLLTKYDNLYCDISGRSGYNALGRDKKMVKIFLEKHYRKILFGSDNTGYDLEGLLESFNLEKKVLKHIFYENAMMLIG